MCFSSYLSVFLSSWINSFLRLSITLVPFLSVFLCEHDLGLRKWTFWSGLQNLTRTSTVLLSLSLSIYLSLSFANLPYWVECSFAVFFAVASLQGRHWCSSGNRNNSGRPTQADSESTECTNAMKADEFTANLNLLSLLFYSSLYNSKLRLGYCHFSKLLKLWTFLSWVKDWILRKNTLHNSFNVKKKYFSKYLLKL